MIEKRRKVSNQEYKFLLLFHESFRALIKIRIKELEELGITPQQSAIISIIKKLGRKATIVEISRRTFTESHTVTTLVNRMENDGVVRRVKDLKKKNYVRVELTDSGKKINKKLKDMKISKRIISALSPEQITIFESMLNILKEKATIELQKSS
ncbi:MAG: MarR family transcriptional regulator [Chloroflexi bacterium]|nr:MarR family transcriptional regulator [Chloroflexota bacterium]